jgi:hypothetical protein
MSATTIAVLKNYMDKRFTKLERGLGTGVYGVAWDKGPNPTLTRINDSVGMVANVGVDGEVVQNDFDFAPIFGEMAEVEDNLGNVFIRIPKFYIKKTDGPDFKTWQVSKVRYAGFYLPWCFWDFEKGEELPYIDVGKYTASLSPDNKLQSIPDVPPLVGSNIVQFRDYAKANGKGYQLLDIHVTDIIRTLMFIEFGTLNIQSIMQGYVSGRYGAETDLAEIAENTTNRIIINNVSADNYRVGQTISIGTSRYVTNVCYGRVITAIETYDANNKAIYFDGEPVDIAVGNFLMNSGTVNGFSRGIASSSGSIGDNTSGKYPCVWRGIENPFGNIWQFVDGVNITDNQAWICKDADKYASNLFTDPYEQLSYINSNADGYTKELGFDHRNPFAEFTTSVGGGATTYYSDYYYQREDQRIAHFGGYWYAGSYAGLSFWGLHNASSSTSVVLGGRLVKKAI